MANPLQVDPSRTAGLRKQFASQMKVRFGRVRNATWNLIVTEDAFGLRYKPITFMQADFKFLTTDKKLSAFQQWFKEQVDADILEVGFPSETPWTAKYVGSAYRKGILRAFLDTHKPAMAKSLDFYQGTRSQFIEQTFTKPELVEKLRLLYTRDFEQLKGITADMSGKIGRILADGLGAERNPRDIARQMVKEIDGITRKRAVTLARTEIIHVQAEGQLDGFQQLGIEELNLLAEILTAGDKRVCAICQGEVGKVYTIQEARGVIPLHPNCRCAWVPYFGEVPKKRKRSK